MSMRTPGSTPRSSAGASIPDAWRAVDGPSRRSAGRLASLGSLYYTRVQCLLARNDCDAERAAFQAEMAADGPALDIEHPAPLAQFYGLER
jgi:hypothetical protein